MLVNNGLVGPVEGFLIPSVLAGNQYSIIFDVETSQELQDDVIQYIRVNRKRFLDPEDDSYLDAVKRTFDDDSIYDFYVNTTLDNAGLNGFLVKVNQYFELETYT